MTCQKRPSLTVDRVKGRLHAQRSTIRFHLRLLTVMLLAVGPASVHAATITECQQFLQKGEYVKCLDAASDAIQRRSYGEEWPMLKAAAEIQLGRYVQADQTIDAGIARYSWSIR